MARAAIIRGDIDHTPDGAKFTGEYHTFPNGKQHKIFLEYENVLEIEDIIDPTTKGPMYKRGPGGVTLDKTMKRVKNVKHIPRRFIQIDQLNGITRKVYEPDYLEDPAEVARREREQRRAKFLDQLFEKAEAEGGLDALLDAEADTDDAEPPRRRGRPRKAG